MRRSASEIISELEDRIVRLEKSARSSTKLRVELRVTPDNDEAYNDKTNFAWERKKMTVKELFESLGDLENTYTDYQTTDEYYTLSGFVDYSGELYEYRIKKTEFLDALVNIHFAKVLSN